VWRDVLPPAAKRRPIVFEQSGKEYLVIIAGRHHFMMTQRAML